ncbi:MAG: chloride channel protein [Actinomycetota bacterium]|nr:chloride channel protein [Actinomycetota bacterium]
MASLISRARTALASRGHAAFLAASLLLGILVGLGAALLVRALELVSNSVGEADALIGFGRWMFLVSIPIGLLASWLLNRWLGPGVSGGGVAETMVSVNLEAGHLPTKLVPSKIVATAATLGTGGSGGREGPIVLIGGAIGSSFARYTGFGLDQVKSFVAAGAGAGIGASFNAPIAGMMFALEVILSSFAIRHVSAIVVTSVAAAVTTHTLVGEEVFLRSPAYELHDPRQLILYIVLALLAVLFGTFFLRVLDRVSITKMVSAIPGWVVPLLMGVSVALIGVVYPETLGTGQAFLNELLSLSDHGQFVWWTLFVIAALKSVTAALTRKGGGSAGTFMPALVIGGAVGAGFAVLIDPFWTLSEIEPGAFALVGMAAALAATARAPLTAVILVFELTGSYGLVLPLMLASALATFISEQFHPESAYTMALARKGIRLPETEDIDLLDTVLVSEVMAHVDETATSDMTLAELDERLDRTRHHGMPVVDGDELVGIITVTDVERGAAEDSPRTVGDEMTVTPVTITPDLPVSAALARMASMGLGRLPVVADDNRRHLVGMFRRESVVKAYHHALGTSTGRHLYRDRMRVRTQPGAAFFEAPVRRGSPIIGSLVKDVRWPEGAVLVSIRRGSAVLIPHGSTAIELGDAITLFGTGESREQLGFLMEPAQDPTSEWDHP